MRKNIDTNNRSSTNVEGALHCLSEIAARHGKNYSVAYLRTQVSADKAYLSLWDLGQLAEKVGFRARCIQVTYNQLTRYLRLPCIVLLGNRYVIVTAKNDWRSRRRIMVSDPVTGPATWLKKTFLEQWETQTAEAPTETGFALLLEHTITLNKTGDKEKKELGWRSILRYFRESRRQAIQVFIALLLISILQLVLPFLMQSIVDVGINTQDLNYITIILAAQLMLVFSRCTIDFIRGHILLYMSTKVSLSILTDFWMKLMRLPIAYFEKTRTGDVIQRINDNRQVQSFLTGSALRTFFSMFNFIVFAVVLYIYKARLLLVFAIGLSLYFIWMRLFLSFRRKINYRIFDLMARQNNTSLQLIQGMKEIRMQNIEQSKRWDWERLQIEGFGLSRKNLSFNQLQQFGAVCINEGKDVVLTFMVASLVIEGQLTFGAMLALQYIIGQLSGPIDQFIGFIQNAQDAKISLDRLNEVHRMEDEEMPESDLIKHLPASRSITISNLFFTYPGENIPVLNNIWLSIPENKTTAIIGMSGSGKTTLFKVLLKVYDQYEGEIKIGEVDYKSISPSYWRTQCGALMQDSFIFDDTIAMNIVMEHQRMDKERLLEACRVAHLLPVIESLPDGFNTRLSARGTGISEGQKQRLLIARAIYRDASYLFFDESTNALDTKTEKIVLENLRQYCNNKTVIVIAHRLSTIQKADNIIVMEQGRIIEQGTHHELSMMNGKYVELLNQAELSGQE